jgi:chromosome segregation ATPase
MAAAFRLGLVGLGVGAVLFFASPWFRTNVKVAVKEVTEWTPERIAEHPDLYLKWAQDELDGTERKLKGRLVELQQHRTKLTRECELAATTHDRCVSQLQKLKAAYQQATQSEIWPVAYQGEPLSEEQLKQLILEADDHIQRFNADQPLRTKALQKITAQRQTCEQSLTQIRDRREELARKLSHVRLELSLKELTDLRGKVDSALGALDLDVDSKPLSLDDLLSGDQANSQAAQAEERFQKIMSSN